MVSMVSNIIFAVMAGLHWQKKQKHFWEELPQIRLQMHLFPLLHVYHGSQFIGENEIVS